MDKNFLYQAAEKFTAESPANIFTDANALITQNIGKRIYDKPLLGFASPSDELWEQLIDTNIVGQHILLPYQWMQSAKTVISIFAPYSQAFKNDTRKYPELPYSDCLRGPGSEEFINGLTNTICTAVSDKGGNYVVPRFDSRYWHVHSLKEKDGHPPLMSAWPEKHAAYISGLGTFGLSGIIITKKGCAGVFRSLLTDLEFLPDPRPYNDRLAYCSKCGACIKRCPGGAVTKAGRNRIACFLFLSEIWDEYPNYCCHGCQMNIPCSSGIPL